MAGDIVFVSAHPASDTFPHAHVPAAVDWLAALRKGCFITDEHVVAGMRWRADWLAYLEAVVEIRPSGDERAKHPNQEANDAANVRLANVHNSLGVAAEQWLVMLLIRNLTMPILTEILYPELPKPAGRHAVLNTFIFVLEQLADRYEWMDS